jgi:pimeloyl-ACP methyl ester carboxylesterase
MTEPRLNHVHCLDARGLHRMAYWEWGDPANDHVVVCVHGLTRQGRDFDTLARALCAQVRVVCPDVVGRGRSDRLADPLAYALPTYVADMVTLLARLDARTLDWVGTSMGGLIGLSLAALPAQGGNPLRRLVVNDVGPRIEPVSLARIGAYVGQRLHFASLDEAVDHQMTIAAGFGPHTREQWRALTAPMLVPDGDGGLVLHYDPAIALPFTAVTAELAAAGEAALWAAWDRIGARTLLLRGADSDLLSHATAVEMTRRGPRAELVEFAGVGHAPMLVQPGQVELVRDFLLAR